MACTAKRRVRAFAAGRVVRCSCRGAGCLARARIASILVPGDGCGVPGWQGIASKVTQSCLRSATHLLPPAFRSQPFPFAIASDSPIQRSRTCTPAQALGALWVRGLRAPAARLETRDACACTARGCRRWRAGRQRQPPPAAAPLPAASSAACHLPVSHHFLLALCSRRAGTGRACLSPVALALHLVLRPRGVRRKDGGQVCAPGSAVPSLLPATLHAMSLGSPSRLP